MSLTEESDAALVSLLRAGQKNALTILYDRYADLVYSCAYKILQNPQEAEDLTQDIFLKFWREQNFDPNRASLSTFLGLLTRSRAIDKIRRSNRTKSFLEQWQKLYSDESSTSLPLEQASQQERQEMLKEAIVKLPELQRQILEMNYYEGLSQAKIAQSLNLSLGTVKSRSRQALLGLKRLLDHEDL